MRDGLWGLTREDMVYIHAETKANVHSAGLRLLLRAEECHNTGWIVDKAACGGENEVDSG